jgi:8-oxo-dGTP pyrophosphatase MutT (NUDIX family)
VDAFLEKLASLLQKRQRKVIKKEGLRSAAVLVPFFEKEGQPYLLLTKRSDGVQRHRGEIAFPGGRSELQDAGLFETALRECREEIDLDPADVKLIGALDDHETVTGFCVSPFVGRIPYPYPFLLDPKEIKGLIEVPFQFLLDPENRRHRTIMFQDKPRNIFSYVYQDHDIWGATAEMIKGLVEIVLESSKEEHFER